MWVPTFRVLSQEMRHINFFRGAQNGAFGGGGQKVYVEKVYVLFPSLTEFGPKFGFLCIIPCAEIVTEGMVFLNRLVTPTTICCSKGKGS